MFAKSWLVESMSVKRKSWSFHSKQETIRGFFTPSRRCDLQIERWACERSVHVPLYQWAFRGTDTNPPADCQFLCHKQFIWSFPRRSQIAWSVETCWKPHHWHLTLDTWHTSIAPSSEAEVQCQLQLQQLETCDLCLCWTWFAPWSKFRRSLESKCGTSMNFHFPACFKFHQRREKDIMNHSIIPTFESLPTTQRNVVVREVPSGPTDWYDLNFLPDRSVVQSHPQWFESSLVDQWKSMAQHSTDLSSVQRLLNLYQRISTKIMNEDQDPSIEWRITYHHRVEKHPRKFPFPLRRRRWPIFLGKNTTTFN